MRAGLTPIQWLMVVLAGMLIAGVIMFAVYGDAVGGLTDIFNRSADQGTGSEGRLDEPFGESAGPTNGSQFDVLSRPIPPPAHGGEAL